MTLDRLINILVMVTLVEMMVATGLTVTLLDLASIARNARLVLMASLANYVVFPAAAVGLLLLFRPHPMVSAGFLVLAVCPGAPFAPPLTAIARGNVTAAIGLMVILAASSAIIAPLLLHFLLPFVSQTQSLEIDTMKIVTTLLVTQLVPLGVGVAIRQCRPAVAAQLQKPANLLSKILNLAVVALILFAQAHLLTEIRPRGYVGMLALLIISWAAGWLLGGSAADTRRAMTLTTSLRNVGVGLVIATSAFADTPAVTAVLAYGILEIFGSLLLALAWKAARSKEV